MSRAVLCALLAFLHAGVWALVTPSFHVPDEPQHVAYVQYLAETGELTRTVPGAVFSREEGAAFEGVRFSAVVGNRPTGRPPWTRDEDEALERKLAGELGRRSEGAFTSAGNNPPLYYLAQVVPYRLAGGDFWTRLLAMRLLSALMVGLTTLFVFGFLRELLPRHPPAWTAGALAAGLTPLLGFIGGGVNNDAGLFLAAAATLWALARTFRRGLDPRAGLLVGACYGLGLVTKATLVGFAPGLAMAAAVLLARQWRTRRREALTGLMAAAGAMAVPVLFYVVAIHTIWDRPLWTGGIGLANAEGTAAARGSVREMASYIWQFYLPALPGMSYDPGSYGLWDIWFQGWIGRFGWLDYTFPSWVWDIAGACFAALLALAAAGLWRARAAVAARRGELAAYLALVAGLALVIAVQGYRYRLETGYVFEQSRYLLPLLALYGGVVGLAVLGAGRRWAPAAAGIMVVLTLGHGLAALLLTVGRYYA